MSKPPTIVILTGAGISAESGVATFRAADGLWEGHRIEDVAAPEGFARNPLLVHRFYNLRRAGLKTVQPNAAHEALARLQRDFQGEVVLITQNVDDLHERGGSTNVLHMHGELRKVRCTACDNVSEWDTDLDETMACGSCATVGTLRPDIVWFGEVPYEMDTIEAALTRAKLFVAIGTSGHVYPAAGFVRIAQMSGAVTVEVNNAETEVSFAFNKRMTGPATEQVPKLVDWILGGKA
jgi:NAD-dependent deacetylase